MMKVIIVLALMLVGANTIKAQDAKFATVDIKTSAVCEMCKDRIEKALIYTKGIDEATLTVETKMVKVKYKTKKTDPDKIRKAINMIGYDADDQPADTKAYENLHSCCKKDSH